MTLQTVSRALSIAVLLTSCDASNRSDKPSDPGPEFFATLMVPGAGDATAHVTTPTLAALPGATTAIGAIPWVNGVLPYVLPPGISSDDTQIFLTACQEWNDATGITCRPRQAESVYLTIDLFAQSCESGVGSLDPTTSGVVTLGLGSGCWSYDTVLHELGHAIGLEHEHQRTDRDSYLDFRTDLVEPGFLPNLAAIPGSQMRLGQPYDYFSVMHYSANQGGPTESTLVMLPWENTQHTDIVIGFGNRVSDGDAAKVLALYAQYNLAPAGRHRPTIAPAPITVVSQSPTATVVQITGQFLPSGNGVSVSWHDTSYNTFDTAATIVSESATQIQFSLPTIDANTVPTNLYPDVTSAAMPVWIRAFNAAQRNGTEGVPVPASFPTTITPATAGTHLEVPAAAPPPAVLNAASFQQDDRLAAGSWATIVGTNLASATLVGQATGLAFPTSLGGTTVTLGGTACELLYVSPTQINFYVPDGAAVGPDALVVTTAGATAMQASVRVYNVAPGLFTATEAGTGPALGQAIWSDASGAQHVAPLSTGSGPSAQSAPIDLAAASGDLYLSLYGTGIRGRSDQRNVFVLIDGLLATVTFAAEQTDYVGVDQINVIAPPALAGRGNVQAILIVDGVVAPAVALSFE